MDSSRTPLSGRTISYPRWLLYGLALAVGVTLLVAASTSGTAFGVYNPAWDGASQLQTEASAVDSQSVLGRDVSAYDEVAANETIAVVLSPDQPYTSKQASQVHQFVRRGGTLVVAEDYGSYSNALLAAVNASARIDGRVLRDERYNYRSPAMPVATNISNRSLVTGIDRLTLNHGTVVNPHTASVLVSTSEYAYLDENLNGELDDNETLASYPIATVESVGQGRVVVVSDPSIMINAMLDQADNRVFVRSLFDGHDHVLLDYSHTAQLPPLAAAVVLLRDNPVLQVFSALVLVGSIVIWRSRSGVWTRVRNIVTRRGRHGETGDDSPALDTGALVDYLCEQHPEWSRERARQVVQTVREDTDQSTPAE